MGCGAKPLSAEDRRAQKLNKMFRIGALPRNSLSLNELYVSIVGH
jgi:hypothetical protein